jgi:anti-sigma regulatory factor (Ser/Thr protein kinase)
VLEWHFQSDHAFDARATRKEFMDYLHGVCTVDSDFEASEIVFGELIANVIRHAPGPIEILSRADNPAVMLYIWDSGNGFALQPQLPHDPCSDRGRGLFIVSSLCKEFSVRCTSGGLNQVCVLLPVMTHPKGSEPRIEPQSAVPRIVRNRDSG